MKDRGKTAKGVVHLRTPYIQEPQIVANQYSVAIIKEELLLDICHAGYPSCVCSFCNEKAYHQKNFVFFIFRFFEVSENIFTPKISGFMVHVAMCTRVMPSIIQTVKQGAVQNAECFE